MEAEISKTPPPVSMSLLSSASASAGFARAGGEFTADDLAAADQLVQLSVSGGGEDGDEEEGQHEAFSSSSARSVNNAAAARGDDEEEEEDSGGVDIDRRTKKRYRLVSELYAATRPFRVGAGGKSNRKRKTSRDGMRK